MEQVDLSIRHDQGHTRYEAAIPLSELMPLAPDLWPRLGFNVVVNDNDGQDLEQRKGRLELVEGAMTRGKRPADFAILDLAPSPGERKVSAALMWRRRATPQGGFFRLVLAARTPIPWHKLWASPDVSTPSPTPAVASVVASLQSLDSPQTPAVMARLRVPDAFDAPERYQRSIRVETDSPPGRYALNVWVEDDHGRIVAADRLPVYVYP